MSLNRLLKDHQTKQAALKKETEHLRKEAIQSAGQFTEALADTLSSSQKELEQGARNLAAQSARYTKQTQQWLALVEQFDSALKELGDVQNWVEVIEKDMEQVTAALEGKQHESVAPAAAAT
ncbi:hypothetical protein DFQ26_009833 [Actinomortierella ambigua]|nr:hypothetical protein DFQ26_009833 [Actinomortierella ambigua]